jgi:hypothetical protein
MTSDLAIYRAAAVPGIARVSPFLQRVISGHPDQLLATSAFGRKANVMADASEGPIVARSGLANDLRSFKMDLCIREPSTLNAATSISPTR